MKRICTRPQLSAGCGILSHAVEFACFCGICTFPRNFKEFGIVRWLFLFSNSNPS